MSEFRGVESRRARGGTPITLEEYHRQPTQVPNPPQRGTRMTERTAPNRDWFTQAKCLADATKDPNWFHPNESAQRRVWEIRLYCADCPVAKQCEDWAVESGTWTGWYGGKSPRERGDGRRAEVQTRRHGLLETYRFGLKGTDPANGCRCATCCSVARAAHKRWERNRREAS